MRKLIIWVCFYLIILIIFPFACAKKNIQHKTSKTGIFTDEDKMSYKEKSELLLGYVSEYNKKEISTISAQFYLEAISDKKNIKSMGHILYHAKQERMNLTFIDIIFKSPLTYIFQSGDILKLYFPVDRKLFIDNINTIKLNHYTDFNLDFKIIHDLLIGKIPLLKGQRIKKISSSKAEKGMFLILENKDYYQTISFKGKNPDKMLFIEKRTGQKSEIYFKKYHRKGDANYFRSIRFTAKSGAIKIDISFKNINLNLPVQVKSVEDFQLRKDLKVIQMTN